MTTVLVTGGSGFLGQHVIKILIENAPEVTSIKVLDTVPFERKLEYKSRKPIQSYVGSITNMNDVMAATEGVDCIIHLASIISVSAVPNVELMKTVNIEGTRTLLAAARERCIQYFVHCSTVSVVYGQQSIEDGIEELPTPTQYLFGHYAATKHVAEKMVLSSNGERLSNGSTLMTSVVRPNIMYGELDQQLVANMIRYGVAMGGKQVRHVRKETKTQFVYVGNVAWCFVCVMRNLMTGNGSSAGQAFNACDDTPLNNVCDFCLPYMQEHGLSFTDVVLPYWFLILVVTLWYYLILALSKVFPVDSVCTPAAMKSMNTDIYLSNQKAVKLMGFQPLFSVDQSRRLSMEYYSSNEVLYPPQRVSAVNKRG